MTFLCKKIRLCLLYTLLACPAWASDLDAFLSSVYDSALTIDSNRSAVLASIRSVEAGEAIFTPEANLSANYLNRQSAPLSPFSRSSEKTFNYSASIEKLWAKGFKTSASYTLSDVSQFFFSGNQSSFLAPTLELSVQSSLLQDIVFHRYQHLKNENRQSVKSLSLANRIQDKNILLQSAQDFTNILNQKQQLILQKKRCLTIERQSAKIKQKHKRKAISKRDYYLSLKEVKNCHISSNDLSNDIELNTQSFEGRYSVSLQTFSQQNIHTWFEHLSDIYTKLNQKTTQLGQSMDVQYYQSLLAQSQAKQKRLNALSKSDLSLEASAGITGLDQRFFFAHDDLGQVQYPFIYLGVSWGIPFKDKQSKLLAHANALSTVAQQKKLKDINRQKAQDFKSLSERLKRDLNIYQEQQAILRLSQTVSKEALKDFENGRMDFYTFSEFSKNLLQDQKDMSTLKSTIVLRILLYFDHCNYFDPFVKKHHRAQL